MVDQDVGKDLSSPHQTLSADAGRLIRFASSSNASVSVRGGQEFEAGGRGDHAIDAGGRAVGFAHRRQGLRMFFALHEVEHFACAIR